MSIWRIAVGVFLGAIAAYICVGIFAKVSAKVAVGERARVAHVVTAISPDDLIERCGKPLSDKPSPSLRSGSWFTATPSFISANFRKVPTNGETSERTTSPRTC